MLAATVSSHLVYKSTPINAVKLQEVVWFKKVRWNIHKMQQ